MRRLALLGLLAALIVAPAAAARPAVPALASFRSGPDRIADRVVVSRAAEVPFGAWGGRITAANGEQVTIYVSNSYPVDLTLTQKWADFLTSLVHGNELAALTMYLAPTGEVSSFCGGEALACYMPSRSLLTAPAEAVDVDLTAEAVVTHEYGHHVAAHRSNAPWYAGSWGTKRWATAMHVCQKVRRHALYPGAEQSLLYTLNPGEGFAESYRVLNQRLLGIAESPWQVVDESLYPSDAALDALRLDVLQPWHASAAKTFAGTRTRTFRVATPTDGTLALHVTSRARAALSVIVNGKTVARAGANLGYTVCGARSVSVRVTASAPFRLRVVAP